MCKFLVVGEEFIFNLHEKNIFDTRILLGILGGLVGIHQDLFNFEVCKVCD